MNSERLMAITLTRKFLYSLLVPKETPRVPKYIRDQARRCLRHYPWAAHIRLADGTILGDEKLTDDGEVIVR